MVRSNKTKFAVLGMLSLQPMSGYDIKRASKASIGYFWQESYGQIYPTLKKLLSQGLVLREEVPQEGKPDKFLYAITPSGEEALREWLKKRTEPEPKRNELLLKLFFGGLVDARHHVDALESFKEENRLLVEELKGIHQWLEVEFKDYGYLPYWLSTVRCGILRHTALVEWSEETIHAYRELENKGPVETESGLMPFGDS